WLPENYRDAVIIPAPRRAFAALIEGLRQVGTRFPISAMIAGSAVWVGGLTPAMVAPVMDTLGVDQWMGRIHRPVRIEQEANNAGPHGGVVARLSAADKGQDLQWLVDTGGDIDADEVGCALGSLIGAAVSSAPVNALHPDSGIFADMV
ncbi:MAG: hypothetical protein ACKPKO_29245, partial [Candidatus Fonsibacter sp.]